MTHPTARRIAAVAIATSGPLTGPFSGMTHTSWTRSDGAPGSVSFQMLRQDARVQGFQYRQSLKIWANLFSQISESEGSALEHASRHWPMALQRRFASALHRRTRKRWPYDRFRCTTVCPGFKRSDAIVVRDSTAVKWPALLKIRDLTAAQ